MLTEANLTDSDLEMVNLTNGNGNTSRTVALTVQSAENMLPIVFPPDDITVNATDTLTDLDLIDLDPSGVAHALDNPDGVLEALATSACRWARSWAPADWP